MPNEIAVAFILVGPEAEDRSNLERAMADFVPQAEALLLNAGSPLQVRLREVVIFSDPDPIRRPYGQASPPVAN